MDFECAMSTGSRIGKTKWSIFRLKSIDDNKELFR
jgi:hypothetical protein